MPTASLTKTQQFADRIWRTWGPSLHEDWRSAPASVRPQVVADWDGPRQHAVCWEDGAPYDWTLLLHGGRDEEFGFEWKPVAAPKGYYSEPYNNCVVLLYPI